MPVSCYLTKLIELPMLAKCLPVQLLRVPPRLEATTKATMAIKNCSRFLLKLGFGSIRPLLPFLRHY